MRFGYVILFVSDPLSSADLYARAFGFETTHSSDHYAELRTGETTLAFVSYRQASPHVPSGFRPHDVREQPAAFDVAFVTEKVAEAYERALAAGMTGEASPERKPWGQTHGFLRDRDEILVELLTPPH